MKMFDADETRMIGLPYGEKNYDHVNSPFAHGGLFRPGCQIRNVSVSSI